jgi:hypothetical protein
MKKTIALLLLGFTYGVNSQVKLSSDFEVTASSPYQVVDGAYKEYFGLSTDEVISIKNNDGLAVIQKFDGNSMKEVSKTEYKDFPKYSKIQRTIRTKDGLYFIFEAYNKSEKNFSLYARRINEEGKFEKTKKILTTSRKVTDCGINAYGETSIGENPFAKGGTNFRIHQSFDQSKILIEYRLTPESRRDAVNKDLLGFKVVNSDFSDVWSVEVEMPYTEKEMNNLAYTVSSNGDVFMLAYLREEKKIKLFDISEDGLINHDLDIDGSMVFQKLEVKELSNGDLKCSGFYANGLDVKVGGSTGGAFFTTSFNTDGLYTFTLTPDGSLSDIKNIEFPMEIITKYLTDKQQEKLAEREKDGNAGIADLKMLEYFAQEDGSVIIVGEQQFIRQEMVFTSSSFVNRYESVVIMKVDKAGDLVWIKKLPKRQYGTTGDNYNVFFVGQMSIKFFEGNGAHYILFVDNPKNATIEDNDLPEGHKNGMGGYLSFFKVDDLNGNVERHTIAELENLDGMKAYQFAVNRITETVEGTFYLEVYIKGKKDAMIKLELKD